jgi:N-carbamoyl-L-amino-acid hydrolase
MQDELQELCIQLTIKQVFLVTHPLPGRLKMDNKWQHLRINSDRLQSDFKDLSEIGSTPDGGVHRPTFSETHLAAQSCFRRKVEEAGLEFRLDGAGNHSAFLACGPHNAPSLLLGSHLDSVPNGGRFDGVLGVLSALEVLRTVKEAELVFPVNLEAIDFTDEEGTLVGFLGSYALTGKLKVEDLQALRGGRENLLTGLERAGLTEDGLFNARRNPDSLAGYLELHIEQGSRLINAGVNIGVVTAIVGICSYQLIFLGRADHAGTISMEGRLDAAQGASAFTLAARDLLLKEFPGCVVNVGQMLFSPGVYNIVPENVTVSLEFRSPEKEQFQLLENALLEEARQSAARFGLGLEIKFQGKHSPAPMSQTTQDAFTQACTTLDLSCMPLSSGAGHDAQVFADLCPTGMIFVPSVGGASHSPREFTEWEDCVNGANVLLQATLEMAKN